MAYKLAVLIFAAAGCVLCTVHAKTTGSFFDEPMCSKYHFEEHVLEKLIRLEIQVEQSNLLLNAEISDLKEENRGIKLELASIKTELEQEKNNGAELRAELVTLKAGQKQDRDNVTKLTAELKSDQKETAIKLKRELASVKTELEQEKNRGAKLRAELVSVKAAQKQDRDNITKVTTELKSDQKEATNMLNIELASIKTELKQEKNSGAELRVELALVKADQKQDRDNVTKLTAELKSDLREATHTQNLELASVKTELEQEKNRGAKLRAELVSVKAAQKQDRDNITKVTTELKSDQKEATNMLNIELASIKTELKQEKNSGAELRVELALVKADQKQDRDNVTKLTAELKADLREATHTQNLELASVKTELEQEKNSGAKLRAELVTLKSDQEKDIGSIAKLTTALEAEKTARGEDREKLNGLLIEIGKAKPSTSVAFVARNPSTRLPKNTPILFRTTVLNSGGAYSSSTGKFTAPVSGTYMFSAQFCSTKGYAVSFQLLVNNNVLGASRQYEPDGSGVCSSMSTVAVMQAGQQAWITDVYRSAKVDADGDNYWNMFTGVLVNPN